MWAICGSVGLAPPCARAPPLSRQSAASAVIALANMHLLRFGRPQRPCYDRYGLDALAGKRFPVSLAAEAADYRVGHSVAARAIEGKRAGEHRPHLLVQGIAQQRARTMQPGLYRFRLQSEQVRGFLTCQALDNARNENCTEGVRKFVDRTLENGSHFAFAHHSLRIIPHGRGRKIDTLRGRAILTIGLPIDGRPPPAQPS